MKRYRAVSRVNGATFALSHGHAAPKAMGEFAQPMALSSEASSGSSRRDALVQVCCEIVNCLQGPIFQEYSG